MNERRPTGSAGPVEWIEIGRRRWRSGIAVFLLFVALALALLLLARPVYRAEARLRLGEPPPAPGVTPGGILGFFRLGGDPFANDLELLDSRTVAEGVVRTVGLNATVSAPRGWHRDSLFSAFAVDSATDQASFKLRWVTGDSIDVRQTSPDDSAMGRFPIGPPITFGGVTAVPRARVDSGPEEIAVSTILFGDALRSVGSRISAERTRRDANVVEIQFDHTDPGLARRAVTAVVEEFVRLRAAVQGTETGTTVDSLRRVAGETGVELRRAEQALEAFQSRTGLVSPERQGELLVERQAAVRWVLDSARTELVLLQQALADSDSTRGAGAWTRLAGHPRFLENAIFGELLKQLLALEQRYLEIASRRTEANRERRLLEQQIESLETALRSVVRNYRTGLSQTVASLEGELESLDSVLAAAPAAGVELGRRQRDVRLLSEVLVLTEQRLRQEALREALTFANVQVFDPPALLPRPVWPRKRFGLAVAMLLASLFAALTMIVRDKADGVLRAVREREADREAPRLAVRT